MLNPATLLPLNGFLMSDTRPTVTKPLIWRYIAVKPVRKNRLSSSFRDWHRAKTIGFEVEALRFDDRELNALELERLNYWIGADGAWRCSAMDPWSCEQVLRHVISGHMHRLPIGKGGAGRWSSWSSLEKFLGNRREGIQGEFGF